MKVVLSVILTFSMQLAFAQDHDHHSGHHPVAPARKGQTVAKKFIPTDDLKVRMEKIVDLMTELQGKSQDQKQVREYGTKVASVVQDIFKTCKLEPEADAAIHPVLGKILQGTADFKKGKYDSGHAKIHESLLDYEKLFSHEGWKH